MKDTILVGIDFSECSRNALDHAVSIAKKSKLKILMAWINKYVNNPINDINLMETGAINFFDDLIQQYSPIVGDENISYVIKQGPVYDSIMELCDEINPLLVVIGAHGTSSIRERWLGSNAYRLSLFLKTPVITIREGIDVNRTMSNILLPIDSTVETRQKLPITATLAKFFGAKIHVVAIMVSQIDEVNARIAGYVKQVSEYLEKEGVKYVVDELKTNDVADDIVEYADKIEANLISIMDEQELSLKNIFAGSYSLQIITKSKCPVLISHSVNIYSSITQ